MIRTTKGANMNIHLLLLIFILYGGSSVTAIEFSKFKTETEPNDLCGGYILKYVSPIMQYIDQLQKETRDINDFREKERLLKTYEAELKLRDELIKFKDTEIKYFEKFKNDIILGKDSEILGKDRHIQDLHTTVSELRDTIRVLKQNVESLNREVVDLRTFSKEETKSTDAALKICESSLSEYKLQSKIQIKTIAENTSTISQLKAELNLNDQTLKESEKKLNESQVELRKQKDINKQKDQEVSKLKEQIKENEKPTSCTANYNGIRNVIVPNFDSFPALCNSDIAGPGWTVIQQRINGGENFFRNWETYKNGFGCFTGDFFLGLEKIHRLTTNTSHELFIYMEAFHTINYKRISFYAHYDNFRIAGEDDKYRLLSLGTYSGNADWDRMRSHENQQFSTFDSDNDMSSHNCAEDSHGGWWYKKCTHCNLNGKYYQQEVDKEDSNRWMLYRSLKTIKMMIRPRAN